VLKNDLSSKKEAFTAITIVAALSLEGTNNTSSIFPDKAVIVAALSLEGTNNFIARELQLSKVVAALGLEGTHN
jgi:hypothetical protein